jgi:hypothetical protein
VPVNRSSRACTAFNSRVDGANRKLRYHEIMNGQHFDAFPPNAAGGGVRDYDTLFVPVQYYFIKGMDLMCATLKNGTALPASSLAILRKPPRVIGTG